MKAQMLLAAALFLAGCASLGDQKSKVGDYRLSGPYTQSNLSVYLIHGPDKLTGKDYLTLQEAMEQKKVLVHETGEVNELAVENVSTSDEVYIQAGDIVKGGRQDRTIASDFILPPKSGKTPIASFCVESGRWHQRGGESAGLFGSSGKMIAGKHMKIASNANHPSADQAQVWRDVAQVQQQASSNAGMSVAGAASPSSLQLTLENKKVQEETEQYVKQLKGIIDDKSDVVGFAFAINGKMNSAEIYGNHKLFVKMWNKLLTSAGTEAFAELQKDKKFEPVKLEAVKACITTADAGKVSDKDVNVRTRAISREAKDAMMFETFDKTQPSQSIHRSYLTKDPEDRQSSRDNRPMNDRSNTMNQQQQMNINSNEIVEEQQASPTTQPAVQQQAP